MNILNKLNKWNAACFGLCLAGIMFWSRAASAQVTIFDKDGWTFTFDGRINAFMSGGRGNDFPLGTVDPNGVPHLVMGQDAHGPDNGIGDVGWRGTYGQQDVNNNYSAIRVRSGLFGNILGFGVARQISESTSVRGYISIWSTVESLGRDKWSPLQAEAREGYFVASGPWGSATVGRTLGWLGRTSYEIDVAYGHGFGLGLPCTDSLGPACGHIGTGVLFPGYSAGIAYSTPSFGGVQLHVGLYDPIVFGNTSSDWSHATFARPEGSITFRTSKVKLGVEGLYQQIGRINSVIDPATGMVTSSRDVSSSVWGVSGGGRVELGPVRLGAAGFRGRGIGLGYALQRSVATADNDTDPRALPPGGTAAVSYEFRTFTGYYVQGALVLQRWQLAAGYGAGIVDQTAADKVNTHLSVIHYQAGISGAVYYYLSDSVVLGLDYFRFMAGWYGAPVADPTTMLPVGGHLAGETQVLNFLNLGVTYHW